MFLKIFLQDIKYVRQRGYCIMGGIKESCMIAQFRNLSHLIKVEKAYNLSHYFFYNSQVKLNLLIIKMSSEDKTLPKKIDKVNC